MLKSLASVRYNIVQGQWNNLNHGGKVYSILERNYDTLYYNMI